MHAWLLKQPVYSSPNILVALAILFYINSACCAVCTAEEEAGFGSTASGEPTTAFRPGRLNYCGENLDRFRVVIAIMEVGSPSALIDISCPGGFV